MAGPIILRDQRGAEHTVDVAPGGSVRVGTDEFTVVWTRPGEVRVGERTVWVAGDEKVRWVFLDGQVHIFDSQRPAARARRAAGHESLAAPMPATVIKIPVSPGDRVRAGDALIILEAMKMELPVRAPADGVVATVRCREGDLVQPGQDLIEVVPDAGQAEKSGETA